MAADDDKKPQGKKKNNQLKTLKTLIPFLWRDERPDLKIRVVLALIALALAKFANIYAPQFYGKAVDQLSTPETAIIAIPAAMIAAYGLARLFTVAFQELREALFARVAQNAIRTVALRTFRHLHALSLKYHLERQTGGLSRVIERGVKGIEFLLNFTLFNILPTFLSSGIPNIAPCPPGTKTAA